jgi:hypothetical protein
MYGDQGFAGELLTFLIKRFGEYPPSTRNKKHRYEKAPVLIMPCLVIATSLIKHALDARQHSARHEGSMSHDESSQGPQ